MRNNRLTYRYFSTIAIMVTTVVLFWLGCSSGVNPPEGWGGGGDDSAPVPILTISGSVITPTAGSVLGADASAVADISGVSYDATLALNGETVVSCTVLSSILDCPFYELGEIPADGSELVLTVMPEGGTEPLIQGAVTFTMPDGASFDAGSFDMDSTLAYWAFQNESVQASIANMSENTGKAMGANVAAIVDRFTAALAMGNADLSAATEATDTALAQIYAWRVAFVENFGDGLSAAIDGYITPIVPYLLVITENAAALADDDLLFAVLSLEPEAIQSSMFGTMMAMEGVTNRAQLMFGAFALTDYLRDLGAMGDSYDEVYAAMLAQEGGAQISQFVLNAMSGGAITSACVSATMRPSGIASADGWQVCRDHMKAFGFGVMTLGVDLQSESLDTATLAAMSQAATCSITTMPNGMSDFMLIMMAGDIPGHSLIELANVAVNPSASPKFKDAGGGAADFIGGILNGQDLTQGAVDLEDTVEWIDCLSVCGEALGINILGSMDESLPCMLPAYGPVMIDSRMTRIVRLAADGDPMALMGGDNGDGDDDDDDQQGDDDDDQQGDDDDGGGACSVRSQTLWDAAPRDEGGASYDWVEDDCSGIEGDEAAVATYIAGLNALNILPDGTLAMSLDSECRFNLAKYNGDGVDLTPMFIDRDTREDLFDLTFDGDNHQTVADTYYHLSNWPLTGSWSGPQLGCWVDEKYCLNYNGFSELGEAGCMAIHCGFGPIPADAESGENPVSCTKVYYDPNSVGGGGDDDDDDGGGGDEIPPECNSDEYCGTLQGPDDTGNPFFGACMQCIADGCAIDSSYPICAMF